MKTKRAKSSNRKKKKKKKWMKREHKYCPKREIAKSSNRKMWMKTGNLHLMRNLDRIGKTLA
jgi:hypothetical protein